MHLIVESCPRRTEGQQGSPPRVMFKGDKDVVLEGGPAREGVKVEAVVTEHCGPKSDLQ